MTSQGVTRPVLWVYPVLHQDEDGRWMPSPFKFWPDAPDRLVGHERVVSNDAEPLRRAVEDYPWVLASASFIADAGHPSAEAALEAWQTLRRRRRQPKKILRSDAAVVARRWKRAGRKTPRGDVVAMLKKSGKRINIRKLASARSMRTKLNIGAVVLPAPHATLRCSTLASLPSEELVAWLRGSEAAAMVRLIALGAHPGDGYREDLRLQLRRHASRTLSGIHYALRRGTPSWTAWRKARKERIKLSRYTARAVYPEDFDHHGRPRKENVRPNRYHHETSLTHVDDEDLEFEPEFTAYKWCALDQARGSIAVLRNGHARVIEEREYPV